VKKRTRGEYKKRRNPKLKTKVKRNGDKKVRGRLAKMEWLKHFPNNKMEKETKKTKRRRKIILDKSKARQWRKED